MDVLSDKKAILRVYFKEDVPMSRQLRLLILEDSSESLESLLNEFAQNGIDCAYRCVQTERAFLEALRDFPCDVILARDHLAQISGVKALKIVRASSLPGREDIPFILFSLKGDIKEAVAAMQEGAQDYILQDDFQKIVATLERAVKDARVRREGKRADDTLRKMNDYDPVTHLPNRSLFLELLQTAMSVAQRQKGSVAVLMTNLFQFKKISDAFGYHFGNIVLQQVGERLKSLFPESNNVSRLYENDFALMVPFTAPQGEVSVAEQIVHLLEAPFMVHDIPIAMSVRIGVAIFPDHETSAERLIQDATVAMHAAKETGDDYVIYSHAANNKKAAYHITLMGDLRHGIQTHQLALYYQPKVTLATGMVQGVEALVRWQHPQYGFLLPGEFIPTAEQSGLLKPVTSWNIETCADQLMAWGPQAVPISVNLSGQDLLRYTLVHQIERALSRTDVSPRFLEVEITETALITSPVRAKEILTALAGLGISISIDDFGAGYTSLGMLKDLPVQGVKLDQSLIRDLIRDKNIRFTVVAMIDLVHQLGLSVTAEGVEDEATHDLLMIAGCDIGQGYFYGTPMPVDQVTPHLEKHFRSHRAQKL